MTEPNHQAVAVIEKGELAPQVHPLVMVQQAVAQGLDPDTISKLMDLAERHEANEARKAYTRALTDLKRDLPTVINRDKSVSFGSTHYTHSSLGEVMERITGPLTLHGFSVSWSTHVEGKSVTVTCVLTHAQGHSERTSLTAPADEKGSKSAAQAVMSTITMLERYTVLAMLGIATADMDEPKPEPEPDEVDTARNLKAVEYINSKGLDVKAAEKHLGRKVPQWTAADLDKLRVWVREQSAPSAKLTEALGVLDKCKSEGEIDTIAKSIAKLKLNADDQAKADEAIAAKRAAI